MYIFLMCTFLFYDILLRFVFEMSWCFSVFFNINLWPPLFSAVHQSINQSVHCRNNMIIWSFCACPQYIAAFNGWSSNAERTALRSPGHAQHSIGDWSVQTRGCAGTGKLPPLPAGNGGLRARPGLCRAQGPVFLRQTLNAAHPFFVLYNLPMRYCVKEWRFDWFCIPCHFCRLCFR